MSRKIPLSRRVTVTNTATTQILEMNGERVAFAVQAVAGTTMTLLWGRQDDTSAGLSLTVDAAPLVISRALHGPLATGPVYARSQGASTGVVITEAYD